MQLGPPFRGRVLLWVITHFQRIGKCAIVSDASGGVGMSTQPSVLQECGHALDHLRNALDLLPPKSSLARALIGIVRRLADFVDAANAARGSVAR